MKIKIYISTNKVGSYCEDEIDIDREDWETMSDDEKSEFIKEQLQSYYDWGYEELES